MRSRDEHQTELLSLSAHLLFLSSPTTAIRFLTVGDGGFLPPPPPSHAAAELAIEEDDEAPRAGGSSMTTATLSLLVRVVLAAFFFLRPCVAQSRDIANISAVEATVRDRAFELLARGARSQLLVDVPLPANLSVAGVEASALRVRTNALWAGGINATASSSSGIALAIAIAIPPRVLPAPFARRVAIVFERFAGDSASAFAAPPGYALAAPVVALLAYDADDASSAGHQRVSLRTLGAPVRVLFGNLSSSSPATAGMVLNGTTVRCVTFGANGEVVATHAAVASAMACTVTGTGRFGIAVRVPAAAPVVRARWWAWTVGVGAGGVVGASVLGIAVAGAVSWSRRRRREAMERRAMAGEELGRMTVRGSRMPSAKVMRTRPEVEESPSWR
nr:unnamed protein product [Digitaria exilis]